ncbi:carbohydrate binding domain-containing protein [Paenibacillus sp. J5C_2022]|uniref:FIMAH domain-containing protein n=1 Tax=Paenibacillus sp. J5C2022 TaxID=2977129 RepID=UPI0021CE7E6B|nr:carbohydrate binding domain-containing protein [Paenibacillus sp. J5C2022]MCU6708551.1 carbohydrate binding domain-containing protein [Paenibacillus sp. J5C2022]
MNLRSALSFMLVLVITASVVLFPVKTEAFIERSFSDPVEIGEPVSLVSVFDSAFGVENGHDVMYMTSSGAPGAFHVIDLVTGEVLRSFTLEGVIDSFSHIAAPDGTIYVGTSDRGGLFRYSPVTKQMVNVGEMPGQRQLYGLSVDDNGNVYGGSYPGGKVFKYNDANGEWTDYGQMVDGQEYVDSTAYYEGFLYAGIGTVGHIVKLDVATGEKSILPLPDGYIQDASLAIKRVDISGHYLFASVNGSLHIYDLLTESWTDAVFPNYKGLRLAEGLPGSDTVYFLQDGKLLELDLNTLTAADTGVRYSSFLRNSEWVQVEGDPELPGWSLATVGYFGNVVYMNPATGVTKSRTFPVEGKPVAIRIMEKGPDGALYMSGYPGGKGAKYDPATGQTAVFGLNQAEGMVAIGDTLYMGIYPEAEIIAYDPTQPDGSAITSLFKIEGEDRPFIMTTDQEKLYIGTIPDYGLLGGALTIYDPTTNEHEIFHNVVYNQSIVGLAYRDGKLYGSTSIHGGEGINPTETAAKMFVWDLSTNEKTIEFTPDIPGATTAPTMISGLTFGPDGLLWAAADGTLFALDPDTLDMVKHVTVDASVSQYGKWRPVYSRWGADGLLYSTPAGHLTVLDPETLEYVRLGKTPVMALGDDGNIYYGMDGTKLAMIEVSDGVTIPDVEVAIPIPNYDFEQFVSATDIPGWATLYQSNADTEVSPERSSSGQYSLKIEDNSQTGTVAVGSDPFPVQPGVDYTLTADVFLQEGRTLLYIGYYDEDDKELAKSSAQVTSGAGAWQSVTIKGTAPEGAHTARVVAFCSQYWMTTAYYDNIRMSYTLSADQVNAEFLQDRINEYAASGQLLHPLTKKLANALKAAVHHQMKGHDEQAQHHLRQLLKHLTDTENTNLINADAIRVLQASSYYLMHNWQNE